MLGSCWGWQQEKDGGKTSQHPIFCYLFLFIISYLEILLFRKHLIDGWQNQKRKERAGNETAYYNRS